MGKKNKFIARAALTVLLLVSGLTAVKAYNWRYCTSEGAWGDWYDGNVTSMRSILTLDRLHNGDIYGVAIDGGLPGTVNDEDSEYYYFISEVQYYIKLLNLQRWSSEDLISKGYLQPWTFQKPSEGKKPSIETIEMPDREFNIVGVVGNGAFQFQYNLKNVRFFEHSVIKRLGPSSFQECSSLTTESCQAILDHLADGTDIGDQAFDRCLTGISGNITIPPTVRKIGKYAFSRCEKMQGVTISEGVTSIGEHAFNECFDMKTTSIPSTVTEVNNYAFVSCHTLKDLTVDDNAKFTIGEGAFTLCYDALFDKNFLVDHLDENQTVIYPKTFRTCNSLKEIVIPSRITKIESGNKDGDGAFQYTLGMEKVTFEDRNHTLDIENYAFKPQKTIGESDHQSGLTKLTTVEFGSGTYSIGDRCFENAEHLKDITVKGNTNISNIGKASFAECHPLTAVSVNNLLSHFTGNTISMWAFWNCDGSNSAYNTGNTPNLTTLNLPANITTLKPGAFGTSHGESALRAITVNRQTAPACQKYTESGYNADVLASVFEGTEPNHVTIVFEGEADTWVSDNSTGYKSYMHDSYDGNSPQFNGQDGEWNRLLTKTMDEANTTYDVYPQQHGIVKLKRHLVKGWNTLCVPFGSDSHNGQLYSGYSDPCNARVFANALCNSGSNSDDFMIAFYRGWREDADLFRFVKCSNYDEKPVNAFETIKVRMGESDLHADDIYTFTDVDVNYMWVSSPESAPQATPYAPDMLVPKVFNGNFEQNVAPFNDGHSNTSDYVFKGTFHRMQGIVGQEYKGYTIPLTGGKDYFYQTDNNGQSHFYTYKNGDKVIIRGFSGWFSYIGETDAMAQNSVMMQVVDTEADNMTGIDSASLMNSEESRMNNVVYDLQGRKAMLRKGINIVKMANGETRKIVVR